MSLRRAITPLNGSGFLPGMKRELPLYLAACRGKQQLQHTACVHDMNAGRH
jgi:hypothetical protein